MPPVSSAPAPHPALPIGVFDSGVGGLSVLAELRRTLPHEDFLYLADLAHMPYGARSDEDIRDLTARAVSELVRRGVKAVVVACNTASAFSLTHLRERLELPIIGLVPAVKPAVAATKSGVVGVLATPGTLRGTLLADVIRQWADPAGVRVRQAVSTALVPLIEAGKADSPETRAILREILTPLAEAGADQLVLGEEIFGGQHETVHAERTRLASHELADLPTQRDPLRAGQREQLPQHVRRACEAAVHLAEGATQVEDALAAQRVGTVGQDPLDRAGPRLAHPHVEDELERAVLFCRSHDLRRRQASLAVSG